MNLYDTVIGYFTGEKDLSDIEKDIERIIISTICVPALKVLLYTEKEAADAAIKGDIEDLKSAISTVNGTIDTSLKGRFSSSVKENVDKFTKEYDDIL